MIPDNLKKCAANKRRMQLYETTLEYLQENETRSIKTELVEHLNEKHPRKEWNAKSVGHYLIPLVSSGLIMRKRKRVLGIMGTYYSLLLFNTKGTVEGTHDLES